MNMFSECSDCQTCKIHYTGGCLAGHGDDDYVYASPEWIKEYHDLLHSDEERQIPL
jgi:hypothetical protein